MTNENRTADTLENISVLKEAGSDLTKSNQIKENLLSVEPNIEEQTFAEHCKLNKPVVEKNLDILLEHGAERNLIEPEVIAKAKALQELDTVKDLVQNTVPNAFIAKAIVTLFVSCMVLVAIVSALTMWEVSFHFIHYLIFIPFVLVVLYVESWKDPVYNWYVKTFNRQVTNLYTRGQVVNLLTESFTKLKLEPTVTTVAEATETEEAPEVVEEQ